MFAVLAHAGLTFLDVVRGRTAVGNTVLVRETRPMHFWGTIGFYLAGSVFLFLLAVKVYLMDQTCDPRVEECAVIITLESAE